MAHYAFLDENDVVTEVIVGKDEKNFDWEQQYGSFRGQACKRTSYNTRGGIYYNPETNEPSADQTKAFRKNYAGVGFTYDHNLDAFIPQKPYESWVLDEVSCLWNAPKVRPNDGKFYDWDEPSLSWKELVI
jgi:hypothetical protein